jgi:phage protein D
MAYEENAQDRLVRERQQNAGYRGNNHLTPTYRLTVEGRDITSAIDARLLSRTLTEGRANQADQLDILLSDHDGQLAIPRKEAEISLELGWDGMGRS